MVQHLAGLPAGPVPAAVTFLALYAVYSLDRATGLDADDRTHPERARFARLHAGRMRASAGVAYVLALALAAGQGGRAVAAALLPLAAVLVYSFPFLPPAIARRTGFRRLKEVLGVKNVHVAATLAATPTLLVVAVAGPPASWGPFVAAGAFLFGRWAVNVLLFDLRDEAGDRANGLRTVPVLLGPARTLRLLQGANLLLAAGVLAVPLLGWASASFALLAASSVYAGVYLRRVAAGGDVHFLCDVVADSELLVLAALVRVAV
jgi:4-hydroxybenzoate polyprenyltransferase